MNNEQRTKPLLVAIVLFVILFAFCAVVGNQLGERVADATDDSGLLVSVAIIMLALAAASGFCWGVMLAVAWLAHKIGWL